MLQNKIDYGQLVERALKRVVRDTLALVAEQGLPGRHHLYITFQTSHHGVEIADHLRARYPGDMTIVIQHEFWGLEVDDDGFAVTLSFDRVPQRLRVPYAAIKVFADPSVEFGLQFAVPEAAAEDFPPLRAVPAPVSELPTAAPEPPPQPAEEDESGDGAEVVTLDRFRKK
jgi:uncharacterized protein